MATYTTLDDVKRVLRSSTGEKVRFSQSVTSVIVGRLKPGAVNTGATDQNFDMSFDYGQIEVAPEFEGNYLIEFIFESDKDFKVFEVDEKIKRKMLLGNGNVDTDYTTPTGLITVPSECWGGIIKASDFLSVRFDSHLSDEHGIEYIDDAEIMIDAMLEDAHVIFREPPNDRVFVVGSVPDRIKVAATYLAAYYIFIDTFNDVFREKDGQKYSYIERWRQRAEEMVALYIKAIGRRVPNVFTFPKFIDRIGDEDVGPGMSGMTSDFNDATRPADSDSIVG